MTASSPRRPRTIRSSSLALAAQATERIGLATGVAIAFPRAPAVTALAAWTLQRLSKGRFTLGLGSQVKGHIERRYGMALVAAGPVDARLCRRAAGDLGMLAERRHQARLRERALQAQPDGAAVRAAADRAPATSRSSSPRSTRSCARSPARSPTASARIRSARRAISRRSCCRRRARARRRPGATSPALRCAAMPLIATAPDRAGLERAGARRAGADRLLRLDPDLSDRLRDRRATARSRARCRAIRGRSAGRRCPASSTTRCSTTTR